MNESTTTGDFKLLKEKREGKNKSEPKRSFLLGSPVKRKQN